MSCNSHKDTAGGQADTTDDGIPAGVGNSDCYVYQTKGDSAFLRIDTGKDDRVAGELSYDFHEKDRNRGQFTGTLNGDTILARYTFQAEGSESIREVVFLKKGSGWVEGFGEVKDSAGVTLFKDRSKLDFEKGLHFEPSECPPGKQ
ncbi:hypothetical protein GCM10010967_09440 [Dyadobacter beijingensis]|uniref:Uncharacterized protein n=1 Tax=Dyadobacter beijingensis TaxID=365489 RepID=A0ABQ2HGU1_9BACT|nr:hypothetical protein GCM10010967_09440 [Dyadobacter beijingensis]